MLDTDHQICSIMMICRILLIGWNDFGYILESLCDTQLEQFLFTMDLKRRSLIIIISNLLNLHDIPITKGSLYQNYIGQKYLFRFFNNLSKHKSLYGEI
jgi:hypothetical protein